MITCCVLGAGNHSRLQHGAPLAHLKKARPDALRLAAVCDLQEERAAAYASEFGFERTYGDYRRMIEYERPDAVIAITPLELTLPMGRELLSYGVPVMLEKPPGRTAGEARQLLDAAEAHGTAHMISFNRRFSPAFEPARAWLAQSGRRVHCIAGRMLRQRRRESSFVTGTGVHLIDATLSFFESVTRVTSRRWETPSGGQSATAVIDGDGITASLVIAPDAGATAETYELIGADFPIFVDVRAPSVVITEAGRVVLDRRLDEEPAYIACGAYAETVAFIDGVASGEQLRPSLRDGYRTMTIADAIEHGEEWDGSL
jgi:predicted dehydrogenase